MKNLGIYLSAFLFLCLQSPIQAQNSPQKPTPSQHHSLLLSDLPRSLQLQFKLQNSAVATHHEFYDQTVELMDSKGQTIHYREQFAQKGSYKIKKTGQQILASKFIWFFSPDGSDEQPEGDIWAKCTAELPCHTLTQELMDELQQLKQPIQLWLASGYYLLPQDKRSPSSHVLLLHHQFEILGRSRDFLYQAMAEERPALKGSLVWNGYKNHEGIKGYAEAIRITTEKNPVELGSRFVDANIASTGEIMIENSELFKTQEGYGSNVLAPSIYFYHSTAFVSSEYSTNLIGEDMVAVDSSKLTATGVHSANVSNGRDSFTYVAIAELNTLKTCYSQNIYAFSRSIAVVSSTINAQTEENCYTPHVVAIYAPVAVVFPIWVDDSVLNLSSHDRSDGIDSFDSHLVLRGSHIVLHGDKTAYAITADKVEYIGEPSTINVTAPEKAGIYFDYHLPKEVQNISLSPSLCQVNASEWLNC